MSVQTSTKVINTAINQHTCSSDNGENIKRRELNIRLRRQQHNVRFSRLGAKLSVVHNYDCDCDCDNFMHCKCNILRFRVHNNYDCDCDATAAWLRPFSLRGGARLQPITMQESVWAWSTSCSVIVFCYFHVFRPINRPKHNLIFTDILLFNYTIPQTFTVTSEHIRFYFLVFFSVLHFLVVVSVR